MSPRMVCLVCWGAIPALLLLLLLAVVVDAAT